MPCTPSLTLNSLCPAVLVPYLPIAPEVAAKKLHELYGMELLPWLSSGEASCYAMTVGQHVLTQPAGVPSCSSATRAGSQTV